METLVQAFGLGVMQEAIRLTAGAVNETWRVRTEQGTFILQALHPVFGLGVTQNGVVAGEFLRKQGLPVPQYLTSPAGQLHLIFQERPWRVMTCLPGTTHRIAPNGDYLYQAGLFTGKFHQLIAGLTDDLHAQIPHFHDTDWILATLQTQPWNGAVLAERAFFDAEVPRWPLPDWPHQIIHGDLKLTNFLFNDQGQVSGLVDLDTLMVHSLAVELGDALRSWCTVGETFNCAFLARALTGYAQTNPLAPDRWHGVLNGLKRITLELGMRYLQDYFDNCYFQWDSSQYPSRVAHNLARARRQIAVYQDLLAQETQVLQILSRLAA